MTNLYLLTAMMKLFFSSAICLLLVNVHVDSYDKTALHHTEDGEILWGGDMVLTPDQIDDLYGLHPIETRKARRGKNGMWPKGEILYKISQSSEKDREVIVEAIQHWKDNTCLNFFEIGGSSGVPHIVFKKLKGCYSPVGRQWFRTDGQSISIGPNCNNMGIVAHEIAHSVGFYHEHNRPDRDDHVVVFQDNINPNETNNFDIYPSIVTLGVPYDINSLMHYGAHDFSVNEFNALSPINPMDEFKIGQRNALSFYDIKLANLMYNCSGDCKDGPDCLNEGFVNKNCECVCPPGFSGQRCEEQHPLPAPPCGGIITEPGIISSPNYPQNPPAKTNCVWQIKAPSGKKVKTHFRDFHLNHRGQIYVTCFWDFLEVRNGRSIYHGKKYCNDELQDVTTTSEENFTFLLYKSTKGDYKGFEVETTFV